MDLEAQMAQMNFLKSMDDMQRKYTAYAGRKCTFVDRDKKVYEAMIERARVVRTSHNSSDELNGNHENRCTPVFDVTVSYPQGRKSTIFGVMAYIEGESSHLPFGSYIKDIVDPATEPKQQKGK